MRRTRSTTPPIRERSSRLTCAPASRPPARVNPTLASSAQGGGHEEFEHVRSALAVATITGTAAAQFPARPVKIVVGFPPGSTPDLVTRTVAERMGAGLGQTVVVENRPGAGSTIATEIVARSTADGYTLIVSGCSGDGIVYGFVMTGRAPFDPFVDFTPVGRVMRDHWVVAVSQSLGVGSLEELVALGRSRPGALTFPSLGTGTSQHLQAERFRLRVGMDATTCPTRTARSPTSSPAACRTRCSLPRPWCRTSSPASSRGSPCYRARGLRRCPTSRPPPKPVCPT